MHRKWRVPLLLFGIFLLTACQLSGESVLLQPSDTPTLAISTPLPTTDWVQVYFSDPGGPNSKSLRGGPDKALAEAIKNARLSVDLAEYDLNLWSVRDALLDAQQRGVSVRMVTDSDNLDEKEVQELIKAGIPVLGDRREGLMHDKFVVIDGQDVWGGSMNLTVNSAYRNNDNLIHIHSPQLAKDYSTEFEEMFLKDQFGPGSPANTPYPSLEIGGSQVEVYFSPDDGVQKQIVRLIRSAKKSVKFLAYSFTSDEIAQAMLERSQAGIPVSGVFEAEQVQSNQGSEYDNLRTAGLDVRKDGNPQNMHHKTLIIDDEIVLTGSYNFSYNAENNNDENVLIIHDPGVASRYLQEFNKVFDQAKP
jgi:phosphatidylserine/phosphatidylglycerophosphate/cardiolipin synthase-like enzyme